MYRKNPIIIWAVQWFPGDAVAGVLRLPPMTVDAKLLRGITFDMPARYVLNTPSGQIDLNCGDWIISFKNGEYWRERDCDFRALYSPVGYHQKPGMFQIDARLKAILLIIVFFSLLVWAMIKGG